MIANNEVLESMQADILGILQHTPSLKGHVFMDNEGDFNSRLEKSLGTKTAGSTGKRGMAIIVLQVDITDADKNLPGPPLTIRVRVLVIENIVINRSAAKGTLQKSSQAALNILNTLQLTSLGAHSLYADKSPIAPQTVPEGLSSHMVTLYVRSGMNPVQKPAQVQVSVSSVASYLTISGATPAIPPLYLAGTENDAPYYNADGVQDYMPKPQSIRVDGRWYIDDGGEAAWGSTQGWAVSPHLAAGWTAEEGTALGTPVVALHPAGDVLTMTCATPDSAIYFTTDGSYPSPEKTLYTAHFALPEVGTVIRAAAYVDGMPPSDILEFTVTA